MLECASALLILLFLYASLSKFMDFQTFINENEQPAPAEGLDPVPRLVHPLYGDHLVHPADLRTYKTVRFLWLCGVDGFVHCLCDAHSLTFFSPCSLLMWWDHQTVDLATAFGAKLIFFSAIA